MEADRVFRRIERYMKLLGREIVAFDKTKNILRVRERVRDEEVVVEIRISSEWVMGLLELGKIGDYKNSCELFRKLLEANFDHPEYVYSIKGDRIYAVMYVSVDALNLDVFYSEYRRLFHAYRYFKDVVK